MPTGGPLPGPMNLINCVSMPKYDADYGKWVRAFVGRYWSGGEAGLWAIDHWNEPWEPASCGLGRRLGPLLPTPGGALPRGARRCPGDQSPRPVRS